MKLVLLFCAASLLLLASAANATSDQPDFSRGNGLFSALSHCSKSSLSFGTEHPSQDELYDCFEAGHLGRSGNSPLGPDI